MVQHVGDLAHLLAGRGLHGQPDELIIADVVRVSGVSQLGSAIATLTSVQFAPAPQPASGGLAARLATSDANSLAIEASVAYPRPLSFSTAARQRSMRAASISVRMSASLNWIAWCSAIGWPKVCRRWA